MKRLLLWKLCVKFFLYAFLFNILSKDLEFSEIAFYPLVLCAHNVRCFFLYFSFFLYAITIVWMVLKRNLHYVLWSWVYAFAVAVVVAWYTLWMCALRSFSLASLYAYSTFTSVSASVRLCDWSTHKIRCTVHTKRYFKDRAREICNAHDFLI